MHRAGLFALAALAACSLLARPVAAEEFVAADYILPFSDATVSEVRKLLADGTIHGDSLGLP